MLTLAAAVGPVCDLRGLSVMLAYGVVVESLVKVAEAGIGLHVGVNSTLRHYRLHQFGAVAICPVCLPGGRQAHGTCHPHLGGGMAAQHHGEQVVGIIHLINTNIPRPKYLWTGEGHQSRVATSFPPGFSYGAR